MIVYICHILQLEVISFKFIFKKMLKQILLKFKFVLFTQGTRLLKKFIFINGMFNTTHYQFQSLVRIADKKKKFTELALIS